MATTAYVIHSRYDPADRERLERETGQLGYTEEDWEKEAYLAFKRRLAPPPRFVPASRAADATTPAPSNTAEDVAGWYRSLTTQTKPTTVSRADVGPSTSVQTVARAPETRSKNNWFIMNALASEPLPSAAPPPSLADILARDPPPLPHEAQYKPPVWLALGPANRGFSMLQNSGWSEGEALGPDIVRQPKLHDSHDMIPESTLRADKSPVKEEITECTVESAEIIDLTMSDSESEPSDEDMEHDLPAATDAEGSSRKALITPLGIVLKSDRLGIGLKAKTVGPYKASMKRITPNAAALAAHIRASDDLRKQKKRDGRGKRGFTSRRKTEEANRKALLAYMNAG